MLVTVAILGSAITLLSRSAESVISDPVEIDAVYIQTNTPNGVLVDEEGNIIGITADE